MKSHSLVGAAAAFIATIAILNVAAPSQGVRVAMAQDRQPGSTEATTPSNLKTVSGVACVDADRNGLCSSDEARIPNVIIRTDGGSVTATDNSGTYTIDVPQNASLEVTIPSGYKSLDGNPRIQLMAADHVDLALSIDTPMPMALPTIVAAPQAIKVELPSNFVQPNVKVDLDLRPIYLTLAGIGVVLLLSQFVVSSVLRGIRKTYQASLNSQNMALMEQRSRDVSFRLQEVDGWQMVAQQLVADALAEPIAINADAGILDATIEPAPKFTLSSYDGREFTFTTNPNVLKKQRLIGRGDKILKLSTISPRAHADAMMLWEYVMFSRRLWRFTPPSNAHWFVVIRGSKRPNSINVAVPQRTQLPAAR